MNSEQPKSNGHAAIEDIDLPNILNADENILCATEGEDTEMGYARIPPGSTVYVQAGPPDAVPAPVKSSGDQIRSWIVALAAIVTFAYLAIDRTAGGGAERQKMQDQIATLEKEVNLQNQIKVLGDKIDSGAHVVVELQNRTGTSARIKSVASGPKKRESMNSGGVGPGATVPGR